jgi:formylglycine-generating enzyme required for sulfatase activity
MGSPDSEKDHAEEHPQHEVVITKSFAVGKTEVTFAQWDHCVAAGPCPQVSNSDWGRGEQPVMNISWKDAKQYVEWLSRITGKEYRLLSEAEWEYAARAGRATQFSFSGEHNNEQLDRYAWYGDNSKGMAHPVGEKAADDFGLHDMYGNVNEWVEDAWHGGYQGAPVDGSPWPDIGQARHIVRGGSWSDDPPGLRAAGRLPVDGVQASNSIGFRVARTLNP